MYICLLCILVCLCVPYKIRNHKSADINFLLYHLIYFFMLSLVSCSPPLNPSKPRRKLIKSHASVFQRLLKACTVLHLDCVFHRAA